MHSKIKYVDIKYLSRYRKFANTEKKKNDFAEALKNLARYIFENKFLFLNL